MSRLIAILLALGASGCGDGGSGNGNLLVLLGAEESIPRGLQSGDGDEDVRDGYTVSFDNYIVSVGNIRMSMRGQSEQFSNVVHVADLASLPTSGLVLDEFNNIPVGSYDQFGYETPIPSSSAIRNDNVRQADFDEMVANGWSYLIRGVLQDDGGTPDDTSDDGQVVHRPFAIGAAVPSVYANCGIDDAQTLGVPVAPQSSAEVTIHGDHMFFNGFPTEEGSVLRLAQWLADVEDTNDDNLIEQTDLEAATDLGLLFPVPPGGAYELTGGPLEITSAWDFVRAQLGTQGHIMGEGECEWTAL